MDIDLPSDDEKGFDPQIPIAVQSVTPAGTCTRLGLICTSKQLQGFCR